MLIWKNEGPWDVGVQRGQIGVMHLGKQQQMGIGGARCRTAPIGKFSRRRTVVRQKNVDIAQRMQHRLQSSLCFSQMHIVSSETAPSLRVNTANARTTDLEGGTDGSLSVAVGRMRSEQGSRGKRGIF